MYQLMYKDIEVLRFDPQQLKFCDITNKEYLPYGMKTGMDFEAWLRQRRADKSRVSVRKLFATLKMNFGDDKYISQFRKPTDFWWIKKIDSKDTFESEIADFHEISLNISAKVPKIPQNYEAANIGSYEKGWKDNQLLKTGTVDEYFSELLYAKISSLYMKTASYEIKKLANRKFIATNNFINQASGEYLVLADEWTHTGPDKEFEEWFNDLKEELPLQEVETFKIMHFLDIVLNNFDRHCQNFGYVYTENNGRQVASNFDFNLSIIGFNGLAGLGGNEIQVENYFKLFDDIPESVKKMPDVEWLRREILNICNQLEVDSTEYLKVGGWILNRWEKLLKGEFCDDLARNSKGRV